MRKYYRPVLGERDMPVYACAAYICSAITKVGLHLSHISHVELIRPTLLDVSVYLIQLR